MLDRIRARRIVFPAYAGMSPVTDEAVVDMTGFPRLRGDEPTCES